MSEGNEKVEETQGQPSDRGPMPAVKLREILEAHRKWVESEGKEGESADLDKANLQRALLLGANLQRASLYITTLREADLQDADLTDAKGLLAGQLAGANVSGAKLPQDIHKFEALTTIDEASKNTKRIFLAMLLGCAYSVLTIFSTTDARLLTNSSSSPLPIIQTPIPIAGFFGVAPAILLAIFLYFHFYLQRLWEGLADLPAVFPDGRPLDKRAYPWLLNALVRSHFTLLRWDRPPISRLQTGVSILLAWWAVPFTIGLFWTRSLQRHDWLLTGFLMAFLVLAIVWAAWFQQLAKKTLRGQQWEPIRFKEKWRRVQPYKEAIKRNYKFGAIGVSVLLLVFGVSYGAINGTPPGRESEPRRALTLLTKIIPQVLPYFGAHAFADLREQDVSTKPSNWFMVDKQLTEIVDGAQLSGADLRQALAIRAFLVNADLRWAKLQGANLDNAKLQGANLAWAELQGANMRWAQMQRANLGEANLSGVNLQGADLQRADLRGSTGLTAPQVKAAKNWKLAFYGRDFLEKLGLPSDHNETVKKKLAELEKEKKATGAK